MDISSNELPELTIRDRIVEEEKRPSFLFFTFLDVLRKLIAALDAQKLEDAPSDGKQYCRKDGSWQEIV